MAVSPLAAERLFLETRFGRLCNFTRNLKRPEAHQTKRLMRSDPSFYAGPLCRSARRAYISGLPNLSPPNLLRRASSGMGFRKELKCELAALSVRGR
jgi:hypothetical protein